MGYFYVFLTISLTVYGQVILKHEVSRVTFPPDGLPMIWFLVKFCLRPLVASGLLAAVVASLAWMAALSKFELSYAYPFTSLNFVLVVFISIVVFGEAIDAYKLAGLALILTGVYVLSLSQRV
jgi:multidrug transporter EmrE-like cation transporter